MSQTSEPVSVTILEKRYQFACEPDQRNDLIEAARQLDETMTAIKDDGRLMSLERITLQAALNFSAEVVKMQRNEQIREEKIDRKIRMLADQLDDALKD
ncbi:MAG: cell division protein ZapA [Xanthomonadales bacterium]